MRKYFIEVEETKAETVVNLLAQISVKVDKPIEDKKRYLKLGGAQYGYEERFIVVTEEQLKILVYLEDCGFFDDWEEIDPKEMFEEV